MWIGSPREQEGAGSSVDGLGGGACRWGCLRSLRHTCWHWSFGAHRVGSLHGIRNKRPLDTPYTEKTCKQHSLFQDNHATLKPSHETRLQSLFLQVGKSVYATFFRVAKHRRHYERLERSFVAATSTFIPHYCNMDTAPKEKAFTMVLVKPGFTLYAPFWLTGAPESGRSRTGHGLKPARWERRAQSATQPWTMGAAHPDYKRRLSGAGTES